MSFLLPTYYQDTFRNGEGIRNESDSRRVAVFSHLLVHPPQVLFHKYYVRKYLLHVSHFWNRMK